MEKAVSFRVGGILRRPSAEDHKAHSEISSPLIRTYEIDFGFLKVLLVHVQN